jgi:hypothetical protein
VTDWPEIDTSSIASPSLGRAELSYSWKRTWKPAPGVNPAEAAAVERLIVCVLNVDAIAG